VQDELLRELILGSGEDPDIADEDERTLTVRDVPGGTVSFLFERTSMNAAEGEGGETAEA
jgi:hypothetical protein